MLSLSSFHRCFLVECKVKYTAPHSAQSHWSRLLGCSRTRVCDRAQVMDKGYRHRSGDSAGSLQIFTCCKPDRGKSSSQTSGPHCDHESREKFRARSAFETICRLRRTACLLWVDTICDYKGRNYNIGESRVRRSYGVWIHLEVHQVPLSATTARIVHRQEPRKLHYFLIRSRYPQCTSMKSSRHKVSQIEDYGIDCLIRYCVPNILYNVEWAHLCFYMIQYVFESLGMTLSDAFATTACEDTDVIEGSWFTRVESGQCDLDMANPKSLGPCRFIALVK
nr:hypothetical protein CFP56_04387 [Quercus suber]